MNSVSSRLLAALTYPRPLDDFVELAAPLHSSREIRARVALVREEAPGVATLVLRPNARWRGHRAGQYVALTAEINGVRRTRCFSVASAPDAGRRSIEITIKAQPGGAVTPWLASRASLGAIVTLSPAQGDFVLPDPPPPRILLVSGGSGITPVMSMLRSLVSRGHRGAVAFVHYARSERDVIFADELARLQKEAPPNFAVQVLIGTVNADSLAAVTPYLERWETWACGPAPFLEVVRGAFEARGAAARVHVESFALAPSVSSSDDHGEITFARSALRAAGVGPLLTLAEKAGLSPASGCRMGICRTCTCRKIRGTTRDLCTGALSTDDDVDIQLCTTAAVGPVEIDL
jgi:ferredoxin-NADP reductase